MTTYTSPQDGTTLDTFLKSYDATANMDSDITFQVGEHTEATGYIRRGLVQFPGLTNGDVPVGANISSAKLYLKIKEDFSSNNRTFRVYRSKRDVNISQCTWNVWKTGSNWATAGGFGADDCEQTDIGSISLTAAETVNTWKEISLTPSKIMEIVNGIWTTPALFFKMDTETNDMYVYYSTNDATPTNRPYIVVEYLLGGQVIIWSSE